MPYTQDWTTGRIEYWLDLLQDKVGAPDLQFLEIGCFAGRATIWLLDNILTHPSSSIYCVDPGGPVKWLNDASPSSYETFMRNVSRYGERVRLYRTTSEGFIASNPFPNNFIDFVYVDGSHDAADVLCDAVGVWPFLKSGGIMVFDDYLWAVPPSETERPKLGIDAFLLGMTGRYDLLVSKEQVAVRKK